MSLLSEIEAIAKSAAHRLAAALSWVGAELRSKLVKVEHSTRRGLNKTYADMHGFQNEDILDSFQTRIGRVPNNECIYAIGDIHGRLDLLETLLDKIHEDASSLPENIRVTIVFLGDYIDRGLQSKQVIDLFLSGVLDRYHTVFLMGNHEEALLKFSTDATFGQQWASYGGAETLFSYGLHPPSPVPEGHPEMQANYRNAWATLWNKFRSEFPEGHLKFYQDLVPYHTIGDYIFVHAGLRPGVPIADQKTEDLYWIREEFLSDDGQFEKIVVHGHTPEDQIFRDNRRIGLDTGAYITGRLSAGRFYEDRVEFIST